MSQLETWGRSACSSMLWRSVAPCIGLGKSVLLEAGNELCAPLGYLSAYILHTIDLGRTNKYHRKTDYLGIQQLTLGLVTCFLLTLGHVIHFLYSNLRRQYQDSPVQSCWVLASVILLWQPWLPQYGRKPGNTQPPPDYWLLFFNNSSSSLKVWVCKLNLKFHMYSESLPGSNIP